MVDNHYMHVAIRSLFRYGLYLNRTTYSPDWCEIGTDELGDYFLFHYPGSDVCKYYEKYEALFDRWEKDLELPFVKFKAVKNGLGKKESYLTLMLYMDKLYLIKDWDVSAGYDKPGPRGKSIFIFRNNTERHNIKTERALNILLKKLDVRQL